MGVFNFLTSRIFRMNGGRFQVGTIAFATTDLTVEVPTKFTKIIFGLGMTSDATGVSQDGVVTTSAVTFTRPSGGTSAATMNYCLIGW